MDLSEFGRLAVPRPVAVWSPHPLMPARERVLVHAEFLPGETLAEYLERTGIAAQLAHRPVLCTINGRRVPRELWAHVRPKPGTLINVQALVHGGGGGGGKNPIATVLSIALMVFSPGIGGAIAGAAGWGSATVFGVSAGSLIGGLLPRLLGVSVPVV